MIDANRICMALHTRACRKNGSTCPDNYPFCRPMRTLFDHMDSCTGNCTVRSCTQTKYLLNHFETCPQPRTCATCVQVRKVTGLPLPNSNVAASKSSFLDSLELPESRTRGHPDSTDANTSTTHGDSPSFEDPEYVSLSHSRGDRFRLSEAPPDLRERFRKAFDEAESLKLDHALSKQSVLALSNGSRKVAVWKCPKHPSVTYKQQVETATCRVCVWFTTATNHDGFFFPTVDQSMVSGS